jgi:hypothetical protein
MGSSGRSGNQVGGGGIKWEVGESSGRWNNQVGHWEEGEWSGRWWSELRAEGSKWAEGSIKEQREWGRGNQFRARGIKWGEGIQWEVW